MKILTAILLSVFVFAFTSCDSDKKSKSIILNDEHQEYMHLKTVAIKSLENIDTTVFQLRFGMSEKEYRNALDDLLRAKKLYIDNESSYSYDLNTNDQVTKKIKCHIAADFDNNGELYAVHLVASDDNTTYSSDAMAAILMVRAIMDKYGHYTARYSLIDGVPPVTNWLVKSTEIAVRETLNGARISYTDLKREARKENIDNKIADSSRIKTVQDL